MIVNGELGRLWKEVVIIYFKILSQHLLQESEETVTTSVKIADLWVAN
jgi:hypothetical protein